VPIFSRLYYWLRRKVRDIRADLEPASVKEQQALVTWPRANSSKLFYVFQGRRMRLMMEPLTFFRATGLIDVNLVMLRDYKQFFYHAGLNSELPDVDAVRERLLLCRQQMPHVTQTFCLGSSMGGYAGILFGHYLKVDTVYAFSPQTLIDLPLLEKTMGRKEGWRFPDAHRDLALLLADYNGKTRYKIFYCEGSPRDREWAERISHCAGVELCPQPGDSHQVVEELHKSGRLHQVLGTKD
jgi:hypothetical protein